MVCLLITEGSQVKLSSFSSSVLQKRRRRGRGELYIALARVARSVASAGVR